MMLSILWSLSAFGPSAVYLNEGGTSFSVLYLLPSVVGTVNNVEVGDIDGDGVLDIVQGNRNDFGMVYLNNGIGTSFDATPFGEVMDGAVAVSDLNGDGMLDIVVDNAYNDERDDLVYYQPRSRRLW